MSQAQLLPAEHFSPTVSLFNGKPATTSLAIAGHFGKQHAHVMRDIRKLSSELPESERRSKFGLTSRTVAGPNNSERQEEFFIVYFDGFILLVMGYTGKKALRVKLAYITAFNAMRDELTAQREAALPHVPHIRITLSTPASRKPLRSLVNAWARLSGQHQETLWPQVKAYFQLERIDDLPEEWIPDALEWVQEKIDRCKGNSARALPAPELSGLGIPNVVDHVTYEHGKRWFKELAELQRQLGGLKQEISIFARPGIRNACLAPEMQTLYDNMNDCVNMAVCGLNLVQYGLQAASRIGAYTNFNK